MKKHAFVLSILVLLSGCGGSDEPASASGEGETSVSADDSVSSTTLEPSSTTTTTAATTTTTTPPTTAEGSDTAGDDDADTAVGDDQPAFTQPPVAGDLVGRWAHYDVVAYEDGTLKTLIISYGFNDFEEVDGQIIDSTEFCFSEQRTDQAIETSLSDAATQAIKPPSTPVQVEVVDGVLTMRRDPTPTPVGIRLDDPANEALPTDPTDPRIVDDDGDGNPGITVTVNVAEGISGEVYIARREIFAYEAELVSPDRIEGVVIDESEQLVIGASSPMFNQTANWVQVDDPGLSPIILVRVDASWDCETLAAERPDLFPPTPEVDW